MRSIQDAIQQGLRYYDFLRGDERYKLHLTKASRKTVTLVIGRSPSARIYLHALQFKDYVKQRFPGWWGRITGPADAQAHRPAAEEGGKTLLEGESGAAG